MTKTMVAAATAAAFLAAGVLTAVQLRDRAGGAEPAVLAAGTATPVAAPSSSAAPAAGPRPSAPAETGTAWGGPDAAGLRLGLQPPGSWTAGEQPLRLAIRLRNDGRESLHLSAWYAQQVEFFLTAAGEGETYVPRRNPRLRLPPPPPPLAPPDPLRLAPGGVLEGERSFAVAGEVPETVFVPRGRLGELPSARPAHDRSPTPGPEILPPGTIEGAPPAGRYRVIATFANERAEDGWRPRVALWTGSVSSGAVALEVRGGGAFPPTIPASPAPTANSSPTAPAAAGAPSAAVAGQAELIARGRIAPDGTLHIWLIYKNLAGAESGDRRQLDLTGRPERALPPAGAEAIFYVALDRVSKNRPRSGRILWWQEPGAEPVVPPHPGRPALDEWPGVYRAGGWEYRCAVEPAGRSSRWTGELRHGGAPVEGRENQVQDTTLGRFVYRDGRYSRGWWVVPDDFVPPPPG